MKTEEESGYRHQYKCSSISIVFLLQNQEWNTPYNILFSCKWRIQHTELPVVEHTFLFHVQFKLPSLNREKYYMYPWISNFRKTNNSPAPAPGGKNGKKEIVITSLTERSYDNTWREQNIVRTELGKCPWGKQGFCGLCIWNGQATVKAIASYCQLDTLIFLQWKIFGKADAFRAFAAIVKPCVMLASTETGIMMIP